VRTVRPERDVRRADRGDNWRVDADRERADPPGRDARPDVVVTWPATTSTDNDDAPAADHPPAGAGTVYVTTRCAASPGASAAAAVAAAANPPGPVTRTSPGPNDAADSCCGSGAVVPVTRTSSISDVWSPPAVFSPTNDTVWSPAGTAKLAVAYGW
jgi:hypothetical protein